jgi:hypothetical protein
MCKDTFLSVLCACALALATLGCGDDDTTCPSCELTDTGPPSIDTGADGKSGMPCMPPCVGGEICVDSVCSISTTPPDQCVPACADGATCENGICSVTTPPPGGECGDGTCDDTEDNETCPQDCGTTTPPPEGDCDPACADGEVCVSGVCHPSCEEGTSPEECCNLAEDPCDCYEKAGYPDYCGANFDACDALCPAEGSMDIDIVCQEFTACAWANGIEASLCTACSGVEFCEDCAACDAFDQLMDLLSDADASGGEGAGGAEKPGGGGTIEAIEGCGYIKRSVTNTKDITFGLDATLPFFNVTGSVTLSFSEKTSSGASWCINEDKPTTTTDPDGVCVLAQDTQVACQRGCEVCNHDEAKGKVFLIIVGGEVVQKGSICGEKIVTVKTTFPAGTPIQNLKKDCKAFMDTTATGNYTALCAEAKAFWKADHEWRYIDNCGNYADGDGYCENMESFPSIDAWTNSRCKLFYTGTNVAENRYGKCMLYSILGGDCPGEGSSGNFEYPCDTGLTCVMVEDGGWFSFAKYECQ